MKKPIAILTALIMVLSITASALPMVVGAEICAATYDPESLLPTATMLAIAQQDSNETLSEGDARSVIITLNAGSYVITKDKSNLDVIQMDEFSPTVLPGDPMLPHMVYNILVPPDVIWSSLQLNIISAENRSLDGTYNIKPAPPDIAWVDDRLIEYWGEGKEIVNGRDINIYETDANFPKDYLKLLPYAQMRKWKFARVGFAPLQYNPVSKKLTMIESVVLEISYTQSPTELDESLIADTVMDDVAPQIFLNYDEAKYWYEYDRLGEEPQAPPFDYVIITTNAIVANSTKLNSFITLKQSLGHSVLVVTEDDFGGLTGQTPNHRAEKIRQWLITNYAAMGIEYVLLIGDPHPYEGGEGDIPMKMCWPRRGAGDGYEEAPTDFFFADLTGNWDLDGDQFYGEWSDYSAPGGVEFSSEVYVGRIPVYSADYTTLDNILQKIIDYATESTINWRKSILMPMGFQYPGYDGAMLAEQMKDDYLDSNSYTSWRMYQQGSDACGLNSIYTSEEELRGDTVVRNRWAANDYGIVYWWGHGSSTTTWVGYGGCWDGWLFDYSYCSSLDDNYPSFTYQCSCTNGYPENSSNLQYAALKQGGIGTVSATRVSWFNTGVLYGSFDGSTTNSGIGYEYVDRLVQSLPGGDALYLAKQSMSPESETKLMNWYDFNLYGDPETSLESLMTPSIEVNKTVRDPSTGNWEKVILANVSDEVQFKIWVNNNGTGNLTNITVNDTLSVGLEYVVGSATVNGVTCESSLCMRGSNHMWYYDGRTCTEPFKNISYGENVTIEFNVTKNQTADDTNCVNVSAWYNETTPHVHVFDDDCAGVCGIISKVGVFRSSIGYFFLDYGDLSWSQDDLAGKFGSNGDIPLVGDWDGNGLSEVGVFRPSTGYFFLDDGDLSWGPGDAHGKFGTAGDVPVIGDWAGSGVDNVGVFRNGYFYLDLDNSLSWTEGDEYGKFGTTGDVPVIGDWDCSGVDNVGVFRNGYFYLDLDNSLSWTEGDEYGKFGTAGDVPVIGDWAGSGVDNVGVFRNGYFYLDLDNSLSWTEGDEYGKFGTAGDVPVIGDWDCSGVDNVGVFRNGYFYLDLDNSLSWTEGDEYGKYGLSGDKPIIGNWALCIW